uniref:Uncharacterized protein n=1 Tax=Sparus aurata TaxID=8175 RepID=A0A671VIF2_SPAAU
VELKTSKKHIYTTLPTFHSCQRYTDSWLTHCCRRNFLLSLSFLEQFAYLHFAGCRTESCTGLILQTRTRLYPPYLKPHPTRFLTLSQITFRTRANPL